MDELNVALNQMFDADYMTKMKSALSSKVWTLMNARKNGKQLMWKVYSSAGTITVHEMHKLYQLREGKHD